MEGQNVVGIEGEIGPNERWRRRDRVAVPGYVGPGTIDGAAQVLDTADYGWLLNARDVFDIPSGRVLRPALESCHALSGC